MDIKRFKNMEVRYFPDEEILILRKVKAQLFIRFDSIGILDQAHADLSKIQDIWLKYRPLLPPGAEPDNVKFIQLDDNVNFFDENNERLSDCTPFQARGTFSLLLVVRGITKRVDGDGKYKLIIRVKQVKMEESKIEDAVCQL